MNVSSTSAGALRRWQTPLFDAIERAGGRVVLGQPATALHASAGRITGVTAGQITYPADGIIITTALPVAADLMQGIIADKELEQLRRKTAYRVSFAVLPAQRCFRVARVERRNRLRDR